MSAVTVRDLPVERMTDQRFKQIRSGLAWATRARIGSLPAEDVRDLLAELDAVTAERDEARKRIDWLEQAARDNALDADGDLTISLDSPRSDGAPMLFAVRGFGQNASGTTLGAAIDAAIQEASHV